MVVAGCDFSEGSAIGEIDVVFVEIRVITVPLIACSDQNVEKIVGIQIKHVEGRLKAKGIGIGIAPEVLNHLSKEGYNPQYGARPLKRLIQSKILNPIATLMIEKGVGEGGSVALSMKNGDIHFEVRKGRNGKTGHAKPVKSEFVPEPVEAKR